MVISSNHVLAVVVPSCRTAYKQKDWNHGRVEAVGHSIKIYLNGILFSDLLYDMTPSAFIGLQVHQVKDPKREGLTVEWRKIRICTRNIEQELFPRIIRFTR